MNLSAYSLEQLQLARNVLSLSSLTVLIGLDEALREEIECRSKPEKYVRVCVAQAIFTKLIKYASTPDADEARLDQAWRTVRTAVEALRAVS